MLTLVVSLALCRQCVGNSEGLANLGNSQQRIGGSKRNSEDFVNAKLHQQNAEDSGQSMEKLLEVVEVKIFQNDLLMFNFRMIYRFNCEFCFRILALSSHSVVRGQASHPTFSPLYGVLDHTNQIFFESL